MSDVEYYSIVEYLKVFKNKRNIYFFLTNWHLKKIYAYKYV